VASTKIEGSAGFTTICSLDSSALCSEVDEPDSLSPAQYAMAREKSQVTARNQFFIQPQEQDLDESEIHPEFGQYFGHNKIKQTSQHDATGQSSGKGEPLAQHPGHQQEHGQGRKYIPECTFRMVGDAHDIFSFPIYQIIPSTETRGSEAIKLPSKGSFLEISEINTMSPAETIIFVIYQTIIKNFYFKLYLFTKGRA